MKSGLKRSGKSTSKPPSRGKERSTDKPSSVASKTDRSSRATANSKATSQSASRKNKSTSSKGKSASVPKSRPASTLRATGKTSNSLANKKVNFRSKSQSPRSKSTSRTNTSKPPSKPTTPKDQHKKPAAKPPSKKDASKTKKPEASKSPDRSASPSPKRSETPDKTTQKTKAKAISKTGKQAQKPEVVEARRSTRSREQANKPREAESRSESRPKKDQAKGKASPKGKVSPKEKASPSKKKESKQASPKMNVEEEAKVEEIVTDKKMEVVGEMDLLVPDPVSEFIRDSEGHLVQKLTDQDKEIMLRMSLEEILEDENYEVAIKMINNEPQPSKKSGAREEQKLQAPKEGAEDEDGYVVLEYTLFEDWRLLEAALAYKEVKGPKGLGSRKVWSSMLDPATGELLFDGKRTMRSLVNRYSLFIAHLSESEQQMIQELGNSLPEHRMRRLRGQYSKASGQNRLLGIVEQIYDAPEQRMWLNPSTTRNQNAKPVTIDEFVKKSVEKSRGRMMEEEEEEEEEEEVEEKKVQTTSRPKKPATKEKAPKKKSAEKPKGRMVEEKEDEAVEEEKVQSTSKSKKPANKERQPRKKSTSKEKAPQKGSVSRERTSQKGSVSKERSSQKGSVSKERLPQKRSISREKVRDIETEKMLIAQRNYLRLKELQAATRVREEEDTNEQRKKFKNSAGKEVARHRQVQEQPQQPEKKLTKKEKAQLREQRRNEQELKQLKDTWVYDANSLSLSEVFSARKPLSDLDIDPTLSLYVDFDEGFRQFVRDMGIKKTNKVSERDMKWARLSKYAKEYGLPLSEIISIFNRVSCDNQDLELFLNSGDEGLLWTDQEDRDLLNNDQIALRYLVKIKGPLRIKKRREFLLKLT